MRFPLQGTEERKNWMAMRTFIAAFNDRKYIKHGEMSNFQKWDKYLQTTSDSIFYSRDINIRKFVERSCPTWWV